MATMSYSAVWVYYWTEGQIGRADRMETGDDAILISVDSFILVILYRLLHCHSADEIFIGQRLIHM